MNVCVQLKEITNRVEQKANGFSSLCKDIGRHGNLTRCSNGAHNVIPKSFCLSSIVFQFLKCKLNFSDIRLSLAMTTGKACQYGH